MPSDRDRALEAAAILILPCEDDLFSNIGDGGLDATTLRIADGLLEAEARGVEWAGKVATEHGHSDFTWAVCQQRAAELRAQKGRPA